MKATYRKCNIECNIKKGLKIRLMLHFGVEPQTAPPYGNAGLLVVL